MYFKNRAEAGRQLAAKLSKYSKSQCVVIAINEGGVIVAAQIAMSLHANLMVLVSDGILLPGEHEPIAAMTTNTFTYNKKLSQGVIDDLSSEYHGLIEQQRVQKFHKLNSLLSGGGQIDAKFLNRHIVILVSDALQTGIPLQVAADFLKPIRIKKLIIATPLASIDAVDDMHLSGDEIYCLSVAENLMDANHYYDDNVIPDHDGTIKIIRNISMNWERAR